MGMQAGLIPLEWLGWGDGEKPCFTPLPGKARPLRLEAGEARFIARNPVMGVRTQKVRSTMLARGTPGVATRGTGLRPSPGIRLNSGM